MSSYPTSICSNATAEMRLQNMQTYPENPEKTTSCGAHNSSWPNSRVLSYRAEMVVTAEKINSCVSSLIAPRCPTQSPVFKQQGAAPVPVFSDTVCPLEHTLKFVPHKDTSIDLGLRPTSNYPRVQKTDSFSLTSS